MIRKLISVALLAGLAACGAPGAQRASDTPPASSSPSVSSTAASNTSTGGTGSSSARQVCDSQRVQNMVGQTYSDSVGRSLLGSSNSKTARVLKPGQVMTMEYDESRLNVILNGSGAIDALRCG
ncbi:lipoprotein [Bordetella ansorpii]|uniref:Lipoprotein n=1 Tax=Bordetella ansorpii TaxID=288768 RepID=A0A157SMB1_9BORD|nr:I78 family peptidase inhibitor [Bordetella ansorpii]SAI71542.1 lipoprotein [Bordetella ansorpii]